MGKPTIYLAGPITGIEHRHAVAWRELATERLAPRYRILSPMVGQTTGPNAPAQDWVNMDSVRLADDARRPINRTSSGFVTQDELYIRRSDILLVNLSGPCDGRSFGTAWEMGLAWALGKMIVSAIAPGSVHDHAFARRRSHVFVPTIAEAIEYLENI